MIDAVLWFLLRLGDLSGWGWEMLRGLVIFFAVGWFNSMSFGNFAGNLEWLGEFDIGLGERMKMLMKCFVKFVKVKSNKVGLAGPGQVRYYIKRC